MNKPHICSRSIAHRIGDTRKAKLYSAGITLRYLPAGCVIELTAMVTRAQNADCQETVFEFGPLLGFASIEMSTEIPLIKPSDRRLP